MTLASPHASPALWTEILAPDGRVLVQAQPRGHGDVVARFSQPVLARVLEAGLDSFMEGRQRSFRVAPVHRDLVLDACRDVPGLRDRFGAWLSEVRPVWQSWLDEERRLDEARVRFEAQAALLSGALDARSDLAAAARFAAWKAGVPSEDALHRLYGYQQHAVWWLAQLGYRAVLGDEMGLGKTPTLLVALAHSPARRVLVVAPSSVTWNWAKEASTWAPAFRVEVLPSYKRLQSILARCASAERSMLVVTWDLLRVGREELAVAGFDAVVGDEAHRIKERTAQRTAAFLELAHLAALRLLATGTFVQSRSRELWPLLHAVMPRRWPTFHPFGEQFCGPKVIHDEDAREVRTYNGSTHLAQLRHQTLPFILRRTKAQALPQLPLRRRQVLHVSSDSRTRAALAATEAQLVRMLRDGGRRDAALGLLVKLREQVGLAKVSAALEWIEDTVASDEAAVVFFHHASVRALLEERLTASSIGFWTLAGDVSQAQRKRIVDEFQSGACPIFLGSTAAAEGITLTRARFTLHVERWWTPALEDQADDRVLRPGQKRSVLNVYAHLVDSLDDRVEAILQRKRSIVAAISDRSSIEADLLDLYASP